MSSLPALAFQLAKMATPFLVVVEQILNTEPPAYKELKFLGATSAAEEHANAGKKTRNVTSSIRCGCTFLIQ